MAEEIVTIFYSDDDWIGVRHEVHRLEKGPGGRFIIPAKWKRGKTVLALVAGEVEVLNHFGERVERYIPDSKCVSL